MNLILTKCKKCENTFTPTRTSKGLFCSRDCYWNSKTRKSEYSCDNCDGKKSSKKSILCKTCEVKRRKASIHHNWKDDSVGYRALHDWVERELGKPNKCKSCDREGTGHSMHWANISGEYKRELSDWIRLCPKCHKNYDLKK